MLVKHWILPAIIIVFFALAGKPTDAREIYSYRGQKINPETTPSALFLTPVRNRKDKLISIDLVVEPHQAEINTVSTEISYPIDKISFKEMSKENSFCSFFIENNVDAINGKIKISCASPYPGTDKTSRVITLYFKGLKKGLAEISLSDDSLVLANDGYGTNVLNEITGQKITVE
jgi:hypothetical protein